MNGSDPAGQDHDRMETDEDEDSDGSDSETEEDTLGSESREVVMDGAPPPAEGEAMDITPDNPPIEGGPQTTIGILTNQETGESAALRIIHVHVPDGITPVEATVSAATGLPNPPPPSSDAHEAAIRAIEREIADNANVGEPRNDGTREERLGREVEGEREEDSDDSTDEEEHPYWANLKEDSSTPDEKELKVIEDTIDEKSALDHDHWEKITYEPLDDPEYVPGEAARISWTVNGVHGTAEKPNREKIMKSPSVLIGGYYWNIKYYPHGNDGTEQLSIYIECSPTPYESAQVKEKEDASSNTATATTLADSSVNDGPSVEEPTSTVVHNPILPDVSGDITGPAPEKPESSPLENEKSWAVAAQISCIIYNPDEPRVNAHQRGCHRYYNDNPDWGWTRFHGPWDEIHKRRRFQRQALLRNDTLAFTAYIRTVQDDTKALWWHPPKDKPEWDSLAMTGARAFSCLEYQSSAMVAALSTWLHLGPVTDLIQEMHVPDPLRESKVRMRPAYKELQDVLSEEKGHSQSEEGPDIRLAPLIAILKFYGADVNSKMDVVMIWETLRRVLNFEGSCACLDSIEQGNRPEDDLFGRHILQLKQPDLFGNNPVATYSPLFPQEMSSIPVGCEPQSVQETIAAAAQNQADAFRIWESFAGQQQVHPPSPSILQIELHRQSFSKETRKWKKLTHSIEMNETISFNAHYYDLYGMIVHSGDLESKEYYSVIRPEGPGTRWLKYSGDNSPRRVSILTTKQAIEAHEGRGENAEGATAVAYVVLYVRKDQLPGVLRTPFKHEIVLDTISPPMSGSTTQHSNALPDIEPEKDVPVYIYQSEIFKGYSGRGIFDPWSQRIQLATPPHALQLALPPSTKIREVKQYLEDKILEHPKPGRSEILIWPINTTAPSVRAYPGLLPFKAHCEERLVDMANTSGGCRFWMSVKSMDRAANEDTPEPGELPSEEVTQMELNPSDESRSAEQTPSDGSTTTGVPPSNGLTSQAAQSQDTEEGRPSGDTEMAEAASAPDGQTMGGTPTIDSPPRKDLYVFFKIFDAETQTLRGEGSCVVERETKILETTKLLIQVDPHEIWDVYHERGIKITPKDLVKSHETFFHRCGESGADGSIFVAQRRPTPAQYVILPLIVTSWPNNYVQNCVYRSRREMF